MDNVTHTLFAVTLARTPLGRAGRGTLAALVLGSNAPDIDVISTLRGGGTYLEWHRGPTHGPFGITGLALATACLVWLGVREVDRWRSRRGNAFSVEAASFRMLVSISLIAVLLHVLMDVPTPYGTRLLSPFDWRWFAVDWLPMTDIYLMAALLAGLVFGEVSTTSRRRLAAIVLVLMAANYGVRAVAHQQALALAPRLFGPLLPQPCAPGTAAGSLIREWPREPGPGWPASGKPCLIEIAAMPTLISPFRWRVIAHLSNAYELHELDALDARFRRPPTGAPVATAETAATVASAASVAADVTGGEIFWRRAVRYPNQWTPATFAAARTPTARAFLGFSRFPAARSFVDPSGVASVRWTDMRFVGDLLASSPRSPSSFTVLVRIGPDGRVLQETIGQ